MLFGNALDSDVKDLQNHCTKSVAAAMSTNKMIQLNCKNIERFNHDVHTLLNNTNFRPPLVKLLLGYMSSMLFTKFPYYFLFWKSVTSTMHTN